MTAIRKLLLVLVIGILAVPPAQAQTWGPLPSDSEMRSSWTGEISTFGINALVGGLTAGIARHYRGGEFWQGFTRGAFGGGVGYAGKRVSVERWWGAGLIGREVNAVGASMVANAAEGRALLSEVALPAGPVRVYVRRTGGDAVDVKLDLATTLALAYALAQPEMHLDAGMSLSAGAPVFFTPSLVPGFAPEGKHIAGIAIIEANEGEWDAQRERVATLASHERVHVLQHDFAMQVWGAPAQEWLLERVPGGGFLGRHLDLGLHYPVWGGLNVAVPYEIRPWEREAYFLSNRPADRSPLPESRSEASF